MIKAALQVILMLAGVVLTLVGLVVAYAGFGTPHGDVGSIVGPLGILAGAFLAAIGVAFGLVALLWLAGSRDAARRRPRR